MLLLIYRYLSNLFFIPILFFFFLRFLVSKETVSSILEKFSISRKKRPEGDLIWINGVSVGESKTGIAVAREIKKIKPKSSILFSTSTLSAYNLLSKSKDNFVVIFFPIDINFLIKRFLKYWNPSSVIFIESEIWPNIFCILKEKSIKLSILNARISNKSFINWKRINSFSKSVFPLIDQCYTQNNDSLKRFRELGTKNVKRIQNLKYISQGLEVDNVAYKKISEQLKSKRVVTLFSSHAEEEKMFANIFKVLSKDFSNLFFIIIPRHTSRIKKITDQFNKDKFLFLLRNESNFKISNEEILLVDTFGELGIFFKLSEIAIVGGSFSNHGGHNPIETKDFNCSLIFGPHMENFEDIKADIVKYKAGFEVENSSQLIRMISRLLKDKKLNRETNRKFKTLCKSQFYKSKSILRSVIK
mgnify:FL=1